MTQFSVLGQFSNSLLKPGDYILKFWQDNNNDDIVQNSELVEIKNKEIQDNGQMNNNGKSDRTAEIIGNPNNEDSESLFRVKISDIKI